MFCNLLAISPAYDYHYYNCADISHVKQQNAIAITTASNFNCHYSLPS